MSVHGTYDEVWSAATEAFEQAADRREPRPPRTWYGRGRLELLAFEHGLGGEVHYHATIEPLGSEEPRDHRVCVHVRHLPEEPDADPGRSDSVRAQRLQDVEAAVARQIEALLRRQPDEDEPAAR